MRIRTQCRECGLPYKTNLDRSQDALTCSNCGNTLALDHTGWSPGPPVQVDTCAVCGCRHLYPQRDINRGFGCLLVAIGAALAPWTWGLSLLVLTIVDLVLYFRLPEVVVCYKCDTVYRDARPGPRQKEFDLLKHDVLKYGKSWEEVDLDD